MTTDDTPAGVTPQPTFRSTVEPVSFATSDGVDLAGDVAVVDRAVAGAIVCHPHPQYGGNRFNNVVEALFVALPESGVTTVRFDFRPDFGGGVAEQLDAVAALDVLERSVPDRPLFAVGYSFGAMVVLALADDRIAGKVLVAPPLGAMDSQPGASYPTLVMTPTHDQFAPPAVAEPIVDTWPNTTFQTIDSVDHFIAGRTGWVADRASGWITRHGHGAPEAR